MTTPPSETGFDRTLIFTLPHEDARVRVVRLGPVLDRVLSAHAYPPVAERLLSRCDAVLRIPGESRGADQDVARARARGLPVYERIEDVPVKV